MRAGGIDLVDDYVSSVRGGTYLRIPGSSSSSPVPECPPRSFLSIQILGQLGSMLYPPVDADVSLLSYPVRPSHSLEIVLRIVVGLGPSAQSKRITHIEDDDSISGLEVDTQTARTRGEQESEVW